MKKACITIIFVLCACFSASAQSTCIFSGGPFRNGDNTINKSIRFRVQTYANYVSGTFVMASDLTYAPDVTTGVVSFTRIRGVTITITASAHPSFQVPVTVVVPNVPTYSLDLIGDLSVVQPAITRGFTILGDALNFRASTFNITGTGVALTQTPTGQANLVITAGGGVASIGTINSQTKSANGAVITAGSVVLQTADASAPGLISTTTQTFAGNKTFERVLSNPTPVYDLISNTFSVGFSYGNSTPSAPGTINVPVNKQLDGFLVTAINSGQGKMFAYEFSLQATGATQDSSEPIRGLVGRVTNSGTGNSKTSAIRVGATSSGSNASQLIAIDADVTVVSGTSNLSTIYAATVFGTTDDKASGYLIASNDGARILLGYGSFGATKYSAAVYRAWLATGSSATARGFQQMNNAGTEVFYTDISGNIVAPSLTIPYSADILSVNQAGNSTISLIRAATTGTGGNTHNDFIRLGNNAFIDVANPYFQVGNGDTGWNFQMVDSDSRWRMFKQGLGEIMNLAGSNPSDGNTSMQLYLTKGGVTSLVQVEVCASGSGGTGKRALCVAN